MKITTMKNNQKKTSKGEPALKMANGNHNESNSRLSFETRANARPLTRENKFVKDTYQDVAIKFSPTHRKFDLGNRKFNTKSNAF